MNRLGFLILSILNEKNAENFLSSMTVEEIMEAEEFDGPVNTFYKKVREFEKQKYVSLGAKDGRKNTYFITSAGKAALESEKPY